MDLGNRICRTKEEFRRAVMSFLENIAEYKEAVDLLLTINSRLVDSNHFFLTISLPLTPGKCKNGMLYHKASRCH